MICCFLSFAEDENLVMPEVPVDEAVMDPVAASEELRDSGEGPESPPGMKMIFFLNLLTHIFVFLSADLPEDSDFEPSMDMAFDDASDEQMEIESTPLIMEEGIS